MLYSTLVTVIAVTTGFENVIETNKVTLNIGIRIGNTVTNTSLCRKINHHIKVIISKKPINKSLVRKVTLDKGVVLELLKLRQTGLLDADVIIIVHVVQTNDLGIRLSGQDTFGKVGADKTGCTGNEYCFTHFYHPYPFLHTILLTTFT